MKFLSIISILILGQLLWACHRINTIPEPDIDPALLPYWRKFLAEGNKRGKTFSPEQLALTIRFSNEPSKQGVAGLANLQTRIIDIDPSWKSFTEEDKEKLIFHELGHLLLRRVHTFFRLPNNEIGSLMWTVENRNDNCSGPIYKGNLRQKYYLDELFNPLILNPVWATNDSPYTLLSSLPDANVIGKTEWSENAEWVNLVNTSPDQLSYRLSQGIMQLTVGRQTQSNGFKLPLNTLFPVLATTQLQFYEVHFRYKLYSRGFEVGWSVNDTDSNNYFVSSNFCNSVQDDLGAGIGYSAFFWPKQRIQKLNDWNDLILRYKDNYVWIWINQQLLFQSDVTAATGFSPLKLSLYFGPGQYDFNYITVTRL